MAATLKDAEFAELYAHRAAKILARGELTATATKRLTALTA